MTIVAWQRECLFGEVVNKATPQGGNVVLSHFGEIVQKWWEEIPIHFSNVETDAFIVMPNHVHGIIFIAERRGTVPVPEEYGANGISNDDNTSPEIQGGETPPAV